MTSKRLPRIRLLLVVAIAASGTFLMFAGREGGYAGSTAAACPQAPRRTAVRPPVASVFASTTQTAATTQVSAKEVTAEKDGNKQAILANVKSYMDAFNRKDTKAVLALFTDDCEVIESDGTVARGLKELETEIMESFAGEPNAKISVDVESLRLVANEVAIEEGKVSYYPDGKTLAAETSYVVTHVKKGGRWLMSYARSFDRVALSPYDRLRDLEWLVGDWVDEGEDSLIESSYRWDTSKTFLLQDFTIRVKGRDVLKGTQRIGWDPLSKQIKGWVFDSAGGFAESLWNEVDDDDWVIKSRGTTFDGKVVTMTNRLNRLSKDRFEFESRDRIVGEDLMPAITAVVVHRPPAAGR